jgi:hypothetical protein
MTIIIFMAISPPSAQSAVTGAEIAAEDGGQSGH